MSCHLLFSSVVKYIGNYGNKNLRTDTHMCWSWFIEGLEVMPRIVRDGTLWMEFDGFQRGLSARLSEVI